ncbi:MAG: anaerobic ribonucleoside-triphosphate reductase activating protein [Clostridia bacterium]|nr:anaerobic ribonucleoside-triphosphate reductase activating protein [Clostridia bacterium]
MNYCEIKNCDIANGEGIRVTLFVSGCTHHCKGCFNKETWDFNYGKPFDKSVEDYIIELMKKDYINGLTLLGGEPFEPVNQRCLTPFLKRVKETYPNKNIWCYTGYTYETDLLNDSRARCEVTDTMLSYIDVLVDGEFIESEYDISLKFRGSKNQRIIELKKN